VPFLSSDWLFSVKFMSAVVISYFRRRAGTVSFSFSPFSHRPKPIFTFDREFAFHGVPPTSPDLVSFPFCAPLFPRLFAGGFLDCRLRVPCFSPKFAS
jgi:hypothetical protein